MREYVKNVKLLNRVMQFLLRISRVIHVIKGRTSIKVYRSVRYRIAFMVLWKTEITRANILQCLKELRYRKHYKNAHYIYYDLTGKLIDDIGYLEHHLIKDYREFIVAYRKLQINRKNSLNVQYVLYQLLQRHDYPCNVENFNLPKTERCKAFHEQVYRKIFESLDWKFFFELIKRCSSCLYCLVCL